MDIAIVRKIGKLTRLMTLAPAPPRNRLHTGTLALEHIAALRIHLDVIATILRHGYHS